MYQVQCQKVQFSWKSKRPLNLHAISELIIPASLISFVLNLTANYHIVVAWFLLWLFRVLVIGWRHNNLETSRTLQFRILVSPIRNVSFKLKSKISVLCARLKSTFIENRRCNYHIFRTHTHKSSKNGFIKDPKLSWHKIHVAAERYFETRSFSLLALMDQEDSLNFGRCFWIIIQTSSKPLTKNRKDLT